MVKNHMLRMAAPYSWPIARKIIRFVPKPSPGAHSYEDSIPLVILLRDVLKLAKTSKEVSYLLNNKQILVDGRKVKDKRFPVGFMDIITIPDLKKSFRILLNKKAKLRIVETDDKQAKFKLARIVGKRNLKGGKEQVNFHDGKNVLSKHKLALGDTVVYDFEKGIGEVLEMKKGAFVYLTAGKHTDHSGKVAEIMPRKTAEDEIIVESSGKQIRTLKKYAFVIGKDNSYINLE
ncbi:30S ribosomal protein S4e [Candidatus Woesearchaeota archaeon]|nr:30S ribosomal protein S4e [Candidatus Woesearchaeota archaeon]MBW3017422.1 30S ribosomal protein S4e [Candidatus Woesearchaeota archaeon]